MGGIIISCLPINGITRTKLYLIRLFWNVQLVHFQYLTSFGHLLISSISEYQMSWNIFTSLCILCGRRTLINKHGTQVMKSTVYQIYSPIHFQIKRKRLWKSFPIFCRIIMFDSHDTTTAITILDRYSVSFFLMLLWYSHLCA